MARNKDPAVLFYTADFLVGVAGLTMEERGQYITLLCLQHQHGRLSQKDIDLAIRDVSLDVLAKFTVDEDGRYYSERMEKEAIKRRTFTESRRNNVLKRYENASPKKATYVTSYVDTSVDAYVSTTELHMENENINRNKNIDIDNKEIESEEEKKKKKEEKKSQTDIYIERFERFWSVYPKKIGKGEARKAFVKHSPSEKLTETMIKAVETAKRSVQWTKDGGKYIPNPSTWLNQERWEDELTAAPEAVPEQKSEVDKWFEEVYMEGAFKR